jgi:hypothetical protein
MNGRAYFLAFVLGLCASKALAVCPYDANCLDNPYGGRNVYSPSGVYAPGVSSPPYFSGQYGGAFSNNPLYGELRNNPYSALREEEPRGYSFPKATNASGLASHGTNSSAPLQGVDLDQPNRGGLGGNGTPGSGSLQGVDPDRQ